MRAQFADYLGLFQPSICPFGKSGNPAAPVDGVQVFLVEFHCLILFRYVAGSYVVKFRSLWLGYKNGRGRKPWMALSNVIGILRGLDIIRSAEYICSGTNSPAAYLPPYH